MNAEVMRMAQNLARNCGYAVFPCRLVGNDKVPARPRTEGGAGFKDATTDPDRIAWLWQNWPGPLIGIATGNASGVSVVDVDPKHPEAFVWWEDNHPRLLPTRTFATRSQGLHLYLGHADGVRNSQGKLCKGIDTRGEGGYVIYWFAAGFECHDHSPPAPWPAWLLEELTRQPPPRTLVPAATPANAARGIDGIIRHLADAKEGERNGKLFWSACRLAEKGMRQPEVEALLLPVCASIGLTDAKEVRGTIRSATGRTTA